MQAKNPFTTVNICQVRRFLKSRCCCSSRPAASRPANLETQDDTQWRRQEQRKDIVLSETTTEHTDYGFTSKGDVPRSTRPPVATTRVWKQYLKSKSWRYGYTETDRLLGVDSWKSKVKQQRLAMKESTRGRNDLQSWPHYDASEYYALSLRSHWSDSRKNERQWR